MCAFKILDQKQISVESVFPTAIMTSFRRIFKNVFFFFSVQTKWEMRNTTCVTHTFSAADAKHIDSTRTILCGESWVKNLLKRMNYAKNKDGWENLWTNSRPLVGLGCCHLAVMGEASWNISLRITYYTLHWLYKIIHTERENIKKWSDLKQITSDCWLHILEQVNKPTAGSVWSSERQILANYTQSVIRFWSQ